MSHPLINSIPAGKLNRALSRDGQQLISVAASISAGHGGLCITPENVLHAAMLSPMFQAYGIFRRFEINRDCLYNEITDGYSFDFDIRKVESKKSLDEIYGNTQFRKIWNFACLWATRLKHEAIDSRHFLLGMMSLTADEEDGCIAAYGLEACKLTLDDTVGFIAVLGV